MADCKMAVSTCCFMTEQVCRYNLHDICFPLFPSSQSRADVYLGALQESLVYGSTIPCVANHALIPDQTIGVAAVIAATPKSPPLSLR